MRVFPGDTTEGLIGGLDPNLNYLFFISTSFNFNQINYEGQRTQPVHLPSVSYPTAISTVSVTTATTTVLVNDNEENNGLIVGVTVVYIPMIALILVVIVILVIVLQMKRANNNQKRKQDNDIVMECSPAYATTELKTKSTTEPVYDTTSPETTLPPSATTEYEIPTIS
ncbi:PREDICTED: uncharacterized protein LOC109588763 [Amphimedon queenslandica]|nr:PREDICTED: uncharacterized protein LOC109588763 [Amphimedon queenslandica]|eukprot:XP_019860439.1 PREDICTED: uncharacterized protein LOC109588763 [Amphimedon queenslandica]